jgi:tetratricopeptide (TPR) repeat protein
MLKPVLAPLIVAALLAWSPARAAAAAPDQADIAEAGRLNQEAIALYRDQRFLEAASKFQAAYELAGAPNVLYNLARSYHQGGKLSEAKRFYEELVLKFPTFDGAKREQAYGYARELDKALAAEQARRDAAAAAAKDAAAKAKAAAEAKAQADAWRERGEELSAAGAHGEAAALYLKAYDAQPAAQWLWLAGGAYEAARDGAAARRQYAALTVLPDAPEPLRARPPWSSPRGGRARRRSGPTPAPPRPPAG